MSADNVQHMNHEAWLDRLIGTDSRRTAAAKVGVNDATISRQLSRNSKLSCELVLDLARAYDASVIDALIETGYVHSDELQVAGIPQALGRATNQQLLDEIVRRTDPDAVRIFDGPDDADVITPHFGSNTDDEQSAPVAARRLDAPSPGERLHDHLDSIGEESQVGPDVD